MQIDWQTRFMHYDWPIGPISWLLHPNLKTGVGVWVGITVVAGVGVEVWVGADVGATHSFSLIHMPMSMAAGTGLRPVGNAISLSSQPPITLSPPLPLSFSPSLNLSFSVSWLGIAHLATSPRDADLHAPSFCLSISLTTTSWSWSCSWSWTSYFSRRMAHYTVHLSGHYSKFDLDASLKSCPSHIINTKWHTAMKRGQERGGNGWRGMVRRIEKYRTRS